MRKMKKFFSAVMAIAMIATMFVFTATPDITAKAASVTYTLDPNSITSYTQAGIDAGTSHFMFYRTNAGFDMSFNASILELLFPVENKTVVTDGSITASGLGNENNTFVYNSGGKINIASSYYWVQNVAVLRFEAPEAGTYTVNMDVDEINDDYPPLFFYKGTGTSYTRIDTKNDGFTSNVEVVPSGTQYSFNVALAQNENLMVVFAAQAHNIYTLNSFSVTNPNSTGTTSGGTTGGTGSTFTLSPDKITSYTQSGIDAGTSYFMFYRTNATFDMGRSFNTSILELLFPVENKTVVTDGSITASGLGNDNNTFVYNSGGKINIASSYYWVQNVAVLRFEAPEAGTYTVNMDVDEIIDDYPPLFFYQGSGTSYTRIDTKNDGFTSNVEVVPNGTQYSFNVALAKDESLMIVFAAQGHDIYTLNSFTINNPNGTVDGNNPGGNVAKYNLTTSVSGGNGTISASQTDLASGTKATVTFTPNSGYEIDTVKVNGVVTGVTGNSLEVTVTEDTTVVVTYKKIPHTHSYTSEVATSAHLKTAANCQSPAVYYKSCSCGANGTATFTSGSKDASKHTVTTTKVVPNNNGTHDVVYTCCNGVKDNDVKCSGGTATCTAKAKCSVCNAEYGNEPSHNFGNGNKCSVCGYDKSAPHTHAYTNEVASSTYLKTAANCQSPAVYYKSCSCGAKGTATFESGNPDYTKHSSTEVSVYANNNETHDIYYKCCNKDKQLGVPCSGGSATCSSYAVCSTCGYEYGNLVDHKYSVSKHDSDSHWLQCANCDATSNWEYHYGGTATCTSKAKCQVCGTRYGEVYGHDFASGSDYSKDDSGHARKCIYCNKYGSVEPHQFSEDNVCYICGYDQAKPHVHVFDQEIATDEHKAFDANCIYPPAYYKSCTCGANGEDMFEYGETDPTVHNDTTVEYRDNGDGTHGAFYTCCDGTYIEVEDHFYVDGTMCYCGFDPNAKPNPPVTDKPTQPTGNGGDDDSFNILWIIIPVAVVVVAAVVVVTIIIVKKKKSAAALAAAAGAEIAGAEAAEAETAESEAETEPADSEPTDNE